MTMILITIMILRKRVDETNPAPIDMFKLPLFTDLTPQTVARFWSWTNDSNLTDWAAKEQSSRRSETLPCGSNRLVSQGRTWHTSGHLVSSNFSMRTRLLGHKMWLLCMIILSGCSQQLSIWVRWCPGWLDNSRWWSIWSGRQTSGSAAVS